MLLRKASDLPLVITSGDATQEQKLASVRVGAVDVLDKPLSSLKLRNIWQHTVRKVCLPVSAVAIPFSFLLALCATAAICVR